VTSPTCKHGISDCWISIANKTLRTQKAVGCWVSSKTVETTCEEPVMQSRHFFRHKDICQYTGVTTRDETRHIGLDGDKTEMLLKCLRLRHCQGTVIKSHYTHKTTTTRKMDLQKVSKHWLHGPSGLLLAREGSDSTKNKCIAKPDSHSQDTVMRHETWRDMETRDRTKTRHTSIDAEPRPRHEKSCFQTVLREDTYLKTQSHLWPKMLAYFLRMP